IPWKWPFTSAEKPVPSPLVLAVPSFAPPPVIPVTDKETYYPRLAGGGHLTTLCPPVAGQKDQYDCAKLATLTPEVKRCGADTVLPYCAVIVIDHHPRSFHRPGQTFAAVWTRPQWFLATNVFLSDTQNGGITALTSGDYFRASVVDGLWALMRPSVFVGHT